MSLCLIIQDKNNLFVSVDSAISTPTEQNTYKRISNNGKKFFKYFNKGIFCSGNLHQVNKIINYIENIDYWDIYNIQQFLRNNLLNEIEFVVFNENSTIEQISPYNEYEIIFHDIPIDNAIRVLTAGTKTQEAYDLCVNQLQNHINIIDLIRNTYEDLQDETVGGNIYIYCNNKLINEFNLDSKNNNEHLLIANTIVGNLIISNNLLVENSSGTFSVNKDGITVTAMTMTLTNASATNRILLNGTDVIKVQKKVSGNWVDNLKLDTNGDLILSNYSTTTQMNSAISVSASQLQSQITSVSGNVSTLTQTVNGINTRVATAEGNISTLNQTATSLQTQITTTNGNVSTVTQTASDLSVAINNTKVTIDSTNGITIFNGGFKIKNSNSIDVFSVDTSGSVTLAGNLYNTSNNKTVRLYNGKLEIGSGNSAGGNTSWFQNIVGSIYGEYYRLAPLPSEESLIIHANKSLYMRSTYYSSVGWGMGSAGHVFDGRVQLNSDIYMNTSRGMRSFTPTRLTDTPEGDFVLSATW